MVQITSKFKIGNRVKLTQKAIATFSESNKDTIFHACIIQLRWDYNTFLNLFKKK